MLAVTMIVLSTVVWYIKSVALQAHVASSIQPFKEQWQLYTPSTLTINDCAFCPQSAFIDFI
jgi:hypothetical protein